MTHNELQSAKARFDVIATWRALGLRGEPSVGMCFCPFHENTKTPSFSIFEDGHAWKCHGGDCGQGDAISLVQKHLGCSKAEAVKKYAAMAGIRKPGKVMAPPPMNEGTESQWQALAALRGLKVETVERAVSAGFVRFGHYAGNPAWFLRDTAGHVIQARRLDGKVFVDTKGVERKALTLAGGSSKWPIGAEAMGNAPTVALCEGGPDFLAALELGLVPVAMLGAENSISAEALPLFSGKTVQIYAHHDAAGESSIKRWSEALRGAGAQVAVATWPGNAKDLNDAVKAGLKRFQTEPIEEPDETKDPDPATLPFRCLGAKGPLFYYLSGTSATLVALTAAEHTRSNLYRLTGNQFWSTTFRSKQGGWSADRVQAFLIPLQLSLAPFNPDCIRGVGCWRDAGRVVFHLGAELLVDGKKTALSAIESKYIYERRFTEQEISEQEMDDETAGELCELLSLLSWKIRGSGDLLMGWIVCAIVGGILKWRPHLWFTGESSSGKTWTLERIVNLLMGEFRLYIASVTTAAGIRGQMGCDILAVIADEVEGESRKENDRQEDIRDYARMSSSMSHARMYKGTPAGMAISHQPQSCFMMTSITANIERAADLNRTTVLELTGGMSQEQFLSVKEAVKLLITTENCSRFRRRCINRADSISQNAEVFSDALTFRLGSKRNADQYGALLAGRFAMSPNSNRVITEEEALAFAASLPLERFCPDAQENRDPIQCADHLMMSKVRIGVKDALIGDMIEETYNEIRDENELRMFGLAVHGECLYIAKNNAELSKLFKGSRFEFNYIKTLSRLNSQSATTSFRFSKGSTSKCVRIPISEFLRE